MIFGLLLVLALSLFANVPIYFMLRDPMKVAIRRMPVPQVLAVVTEETPFPDWRGLA